MRMSPYRLRFCNPRRQKSAREAYDKFQDCACPLTACGFVTLLYRLSRRYTCSLSKYCACPLTACGFVTLLYRLSRRYTCSLSKYCACPLTACGFVTRSTSSRGTSYLDTAKLRMSPYRLRFLGQKKNSPTLLPRSFFVADLFFE